MEKLKSLSVFILLFMNMSVSVADTKNDGFDQVEIKSIDLGHNIYMLMGQGGNIGVSAGPDGVFMIDDQFAPLTKKIKSAISKISDQPIRFMINTHWHYDHTGGNENHGNDGVVIVAHDNVHKRMSKEGFIKAFNKKIPAAAKAALPVITFNDGVTFHLNGIDIEAKHFAKAHTDGDSIVLFKSVNVIHMGDTFFNGLYPFVDASSNGNINGMIKATEYVLSISNKDTKIIPGHGPLANKESLQAYHKMLVTVKGRMQKLKAEGKTLEEIIALKPNADLDKAWGNGFLNPEVFLSILYSATSK